MPKTAERRAADADDVARDELHRHSRMVLIDQRKCRPGMPSYDYLRKLATERECDFSCIRHVDNVCEVVDDVCQSCLNKAKRCPAVRVVNLPHHLMYAVTQRFGPNSFKLHRLPTPRPRQVLGLVGTNGIGKSTALRILAGQLKPNLGRVDAGEPPTEWDEVIAYFRGGELQAYLARLLDRSMRTVTKPQLVDLLARHLPEQRVAALLRSKDDRGVLAAVSAALDLGVIGSRCLHQLSGGELQRVAIALVLIQSADVYLFDEPSSYLDVAQRCAAARAIRELSCACHDETYVVCVEHDLALLDYLSGHEPPPDPSTLRR